MVLRKMNVLLLMSISFLTSCDFMGKETQHKLVEMTNKCNEKDALLKQMTEEIFLQDSLIRVINEQLDSIDEMFILYKCNEELHIQEPVEQIIVLEGIAERIEHLNELLDKTRTDLQIVSEQNQGLAEIIDRLQNDLLNKEIEIQELMGNNDNNEDIIMSNTLEIEELKLLNYMQKKEITRLEKEKNTTRCEDYNEMADLLLQLSKELPESKGFFKRKSNEKNNYILNKLVSNALKYYELSAAMGDEYAYVKAKELKKNY